MDFSRGLQGLLNLNAFDMHASVDDPRDKTTGFADESAHHFYVQDVVPETSAGVRTNTNREQGTSIVQVEVALVRLLSFVVSMEEKAKSKDQLHGDYSFGGARKGYQEDLASLYFNLLQETKVRTSHCCSCPLKVLSERFRSTASTVAEQGAGRSSRAKALTFRSDVKCQNLKHEREKGLLESIKDVMLIRSTPTKIEKGSAMFDVDTLIRQQNIIEFEFNSEFRSHKFGASKRFLNFTMPHRQDKGLLSSPSGQTVRHQALLSITDSSRAKESMVNNIQRTPSLVCSQTSSDPIVRIVSVYRTRLCWLETAMPRSHRFSFSWKKSNWAAFLRPNLRARYCLTPNPEASVEDHLGCSDVLIPAIPVRADRQQAISRTLFPRVSTSSVGLSVTASRSGRSESPGSDEASKFLHLSLSSLRHSASFFTSP
eukprot:766423-Hanusia_phi.AAC.2